MMDRLAESIQNEREKEEELKQAMAREALFKEEIKTMKQDCADLAMQVQQLLKGEEKKFAFTPPRVDMNASDVITGKRKKGEKQQN